MKKMNKNNAGLTLNAYIFSDHMGNPRVKLDVSASKNTKFRALLDDMSKGMKTSNPLCPYGIYDLKDFITGGPDLLIFGKKLYALQNIYKNLIEQGEIIPDSKGKAAQSKID